MKKLKIAVIGVGGISACHIGAYLKNENVELYAFCDINEVTLKRKGEKYGVTRLYTDEETMLKELPEIDAVSVCTWNNQHAKCAITALNAGKHVLCEKPMALNAVQAKEMIDASKNSGKKLMIGFVRRFGDDAKAAKRFIDSGNVGDIYYIKASYLRRNGNPGGWFCDKKRSGGGPVIDLGVHVIDLARYLMGNPKPIAVSGATFRKLSGREIDEKAKYLSESSNAKDICDVEDSATAIIRFDNGAVMNIDASFCLNVKDDINSVKLFGTKGGISIDPEFELSTQENGYLTDVKLHSAASFGENAFDNEINFFVDAIISDNDISLVAEDGFELMKIIDGIYLSAETNKEVLL